MSKFVVAANFLDRKSPFKWLVRKSDEPLSSYVRCKAVVARNVTFIDSPAGEQGFGCATVAFCDEVMVSDVDPTQQFESSEIPVPEDQLRKLHFGGVSFYDDECYYQVDTLKTLKLTERGGMLYVPTDQA